MSELRKAAQALVDRWDTPLWKDAPHTGQYIDALRAALSQPEQEPVAWLRQRDNVLALNDGGMFGSDWTPLYSAALAQPEQEPVAVVAMDVSRLHMCYDGEYLGQKPDTKIAMLFKDLPVGTCLFATPPQRKPLNGDEMLEVLKTFYFDGTVEFGTIVRAIEKAHGIGIEE